MKIITNLFIGFSFISTTMAANLRGTYATTQITVEDSLAQCAIGCPDTSTMPATDYFQNIAYSVENCDAIEGFCKATTTLVASGNPANIYSDVDGTLITEHFSADLSYSGLPTNLTNLLLTTDQSLNAFAAGIVASALTYRGIDLGMPLNVANRSPEENAYSIAVRNTYCEKGTFTNSYQKMFGCIGGRYDSMPTINLNGLFYAAIMGTSELQTSYYSISVAMLNYLNDLDNFNIKIQSGGPLYVLPMLSQIAPQNFSENTFAQPMCDITKRDSADMSPYLSGGCQIIADTTITTTDRVYAEANTDPVCGMPDYLAPDWCVDDGNGNSQGQGGKRGALTFYCEQKNTCPSMTMINSNGDTQAGNYTLLQGGTVFVHNNPNICSALNSTNCFNIADPSNQTYIHINVTSEMIDHWVTYYKQYTLIDSHASNKHATDWFIVAMVTTAIAGAAIFAAMRYGSSIQKNVNAFFSCKQADNSTANIFSDNTLTTVLNPVRNKE